MQEDLLFNLMPAVMKLFATVITLMLDTYYFVLVARFS